MQQQRPQVLVLNSSTKRESGRKAQLANITASKAVADIIRTCLGPRAMSKMLLDPIGGIVMTNDGNAILREIDVAHPAAKSMIELSRTQDEEVGDGTTSVIILAGEMLSVAEPLLKKEMFPSVLVSGYTKALKDAKAHLDKIAFKLGESNDILKLVESSVGTKFISRWAPNLCQIAVDAVRTVAIVRNGKTDIDIKRFVRIERVPGGDTDQCELLKGVMFEKDVTHSKMRRRIENPRILLLDCSLEYNKGESSTNLELSGEEDFAEVLRIEEEAVKKMCDDIIKFKPDLVVTEKGLSDLAQHFLVKAGITGLRRLRKTDNLRIARACGATIVSRTDEIKESDIGTGCGLFEIRKIGDTYFTFIEKCKEPKACTILLRGGSKDILREVERNLQDALAVARNAVLDERLLPGGGATEMSISQALLEKSKSIEGVEQYPYRAVALAFEVIPRTLAQNCGARTIRVITELRAKHAQDPMNNCTWGIDGTTGKIISMNDLGVWEPYNVKLQTISTAIESACMLLRIDEVVSGITRPKN